MHDRYKRRERLQRCKDRKREGEVEGRGGIQVKDSRQRREENKVEEKVKAG